jgi:hypothetical protein
MTEAKTAVQFAAAPSPNEARKRAYDAEGRDRKGDRQVGTERKPEGPRRGDYGAARHGGRGRRSGARIGHRGQGFAARETERRTRLERALRPRPGAGRAPTRRAGTQKEPQDWLPARAK